MKFIDDLATRIAAAVAERVTEEVMQHIPDIAAAVAEAVVSKIAPGLPDMDNLAGAVVKRLTTELSSRIPFFRGG